MKAALIQSPLVWEDAKANRNYFSEKINSISGSVDFIVLPEMFTTGFSMNPISLAENMSGETVQWMQSLAKGKDAAIVGSIIIRENNQYFNRLLFVFPSGEIQTYDKRHLFSLAGENKEYSAGKEKLIINFRNLKICVLICYDLRFPVFSRNTEKYDVLIYVANWPKARINSWDILLKARAIENMSFVIGVNRIGEDLNGHQYVGHSQVLDAFGNYIAEPNEDEAILIAEFHKEELLEIRQKFAFLEDRDDFTVRLD